MKIIIIENELYLAQSIASKLTEHNFQIEIYRSPKEAMHTQGDVYLLSTHLPGQSIFPLISKFKDKIIILMVNYINNDTVEDPLKWGAKDYILKPFRIEELFRKIEHYKEYQQLKQKNNFYQEYIDYQLNTVESDTNDIAISTPCVIVTNYTILADKIIFDYAQKKHLSLIFVSLANQSWKEKISHQTENTLFYITDFTSLKKSEKETLFELLSSCNFVLISNNEIDSPYPTITLNASNKIHNQNDILTIDEYIQFILTQFQNQFPDTELSKKLGMSRKSLWEKRKKYGLYKKK
ncbi:MAG: hypothetical protein PHE73_02640 [Sulfurovaceae bacterium]|nr:hypothetical protein [Sulfurovaceae bacterium]